MANKFNASKAVREKIYTKIAIMSPSGGGKTYSSLRVATGMAEEVKKITGKDCRILLGNTEGARGRYYADEFDYDIVDLEPPYNPELFIDFIKYATDEGYSILILDSSSAEWEGKGGCLELHQQAGGNYQAWGRITPRHDRFIQAIATSPIHIIATMRGKDQYEVEKGENGKVNVKKLGVGAKQRDGFEYEFTSTFTLDLDSHFAKSQKDNTHLFENEGDVLLTEEHGKKIIQWANSGEGFNIKATKFGKDVSENNSVIDSEQLDDKKNELKSLIDSMISNGISRDSIVDVIKENYILNGKPCANFMTIKDIDVLDKIIEKVKSIIE